MDTKIFNFFFGFSTNPFVRELALFLSYEGTYLILVLLFTGAVFFAKRKFMTTSILFLSIFISWLAAQTLKFITHIDRPFLSLDIVPLDYASGYSFPSIHSAIFASIAVSIFFINKEWGVILSLLALSIGLSRIVIGVHYPIDVLAGFLVGIICGFLAVKIFQTRSVQTNLETK